MGSMDAYFHQAVVRNKIENELYRRYNVKKGLRNEDGTGVRIGLTRIADVIGYTYENEQKRPCEGKLLYRGYEIRDLVKNKAPMGFEEAGFLLLFGWLPTQRQLQEFHDVLAQAYELPKHFMETNILLTPSSHLMNRLQQMVLALFDYDKAPEDTSPANILRQGMDLMARMPALITSLFQVKQHHCDRQSLTIHYPQESLSIAENILYLLREDHTYSEAEAQTLDVLLMLHADHGGGNNSTFATRVLTSSGTDTYSAIAAGIGSLKGPRHGGANVKTTNMMYEIMANVPDSTDESQVKDYLAKILRKEAGDGLGLIYGMGHAVYTISDPRAVILKNSARELAYQAGYEKEFKTLENVEKVTPDLLHEIKGDDKEICANVDLYSGLCYKVLGIPEDLFTPLFAGSRVVGWCAHRLEELTSSKRIIRPAYKSVSQRREYTPLNKRK